MHPKHLKCFLPAIIAASVVVSALTPIARADDNVDFLKSKDLVLMGNLWVLPAEKEIVAGQKNIIMLNVKIQAENKDRADLEKRIAFIKDKLRQIDFQNRNLMEQFPKLTDVDKKNNIIAQSQVLESQYKEGTAIKDDLDKKVNGITNENRDAYITAVTDLGTTIDKAQADYKDLAADDKVKAAIEAINKTSRIKERLGPSGEFLAKVASLKTTRSAVASETIPIKIEDNLSKVEVTFNGTLTRTIILDTGASLISLTADLAEQLKIVPGPTDPTLQFTLANGQVVEAKLMILKSVRVGQFTLKDVECAVLPKSLVAAEPLLGGSFLQKFIVKIDPKAGELHLSAIQDSNSKLSTTSTPAPKEKPDTKKP